MNPAEIIEAAWMRIVEGQQSNLKISCRCPGVRRRNRIAGNRSVAEIPEKRGCKSVNFASELLSHPTENIGNGIKDMNAQRRWLSFDPDTAALLGLQKVSRSLPKIEVLNQHALK